MLLVRFLLSFLIIVFGSQLANAQGANKPELVVQYANATTISKLAFNATSSILASADRSGSIVLRQVAEKINFGNIKSKNEEINQLYFNGDSLVVAGNYGLEIFVIKAGSVRASYGLAFKNLMQVALRGNEFMLLCSDGKFYRAKRNSSGISAPSLTIDLRKPAHSFHIAKNIATFFGPRNIIRHDLMTNKIISEKPISYNIGMMGRTISSTGKILLPAYETLPQAILNFENLRPVSATDYTVVVVDSIFGGEVGEMGIKTALGIDDKQKTLFLAPRFTAIAATQNSTLALGDYNGNVFFYDYKRKRVVEKIASATSINKYVRLSPNGKLMAVQSGNSRENLIKIINLKTARTIYRYADKRPDISAMEFSGDSLLVVLYPDAGVDKISISGDSASRQVIEKGLLNIDTRSIGLYNFGIGAGNLDANMIETSFLDATQKPGAYVISPYDVAKNNANTNKITLVRGEKPTFTGSMPPASMVNDLLSAAGLSSHEALFDQMEKDLFVMKAFRYEKLRFMEGAKAKKIDSVKALNLYNLIHTSAGHEIKVEKPESTYSISLKERPRMIWYAALKNKIYVAGGSDLYMFDLTGSKAEKLISFRNKGDLENYSLHPEAGKLLKLDGNKISVYDLENKLPPYYLFSFKDSELFSNSEEYYYATTRVPQMGFNVNGRIYPYEQFDARYNRPDRVLAAMGSDDLRLIEAYKNAYIKRIQKLGIDTTFFKKGYRVPTADFLNRETIASTSSQPGLSLTITAKDSLLLLDQIQVWVNEVPVYGIKGKIVRDQQLNTLTLAVEVELSPGMNKIECGVRNIAGFESLRSPLYVEYIPKEPQEEKVYFVGLGIDKFSQKGHDLTYCVKDITDITSYLKEVYGKRLVIDTLFNASLTVEAVTNLKNRLTKAGVNDKLIIAYSGHGLLDKELDYFLSTFSVSFTDPANGGLPYDQVEHLLDISPARRKLLLIDACHSGEIDKDIQKSPVLKSPQIAGAKGVEVENGLGLQNSFSLMQTLFTQVSRTTGASIIAAAAGSELAEENKALKNGVFTYSLLEYLKRNPSATIEQIKQNIGNSVQSLTKGRQKPTMRSENLFIDWSIGL